MTEDSMHRTLDAALARNSGPSAEDVDALALLISCTEIAQDEHGDGGTLMYEPARRLAAALLASDWLAAHTAAAEARGAERGARAVVEAVETDAHYYAWALRDRDLYRRGFARGLASAETAACGAATRVEGGA